MQTLDHHLNLTDPFADIQSTTRLHLTKHGCGAYTFEDGSALTRFVSEHIPMRIIELGTALGYTACCMAEGSQHAHIDTIEGDAEHVKLAREQIALHGLSSRITVYHGKFEHVLQTLHAGYNMAFFDGYAPSMDIILQIRNLLVENGILICSNLQLGRGTESRRLDAELANHVRWQKLTSIESGQTAILIKRS
jgi:predicted O-methyltransferase YrrM